MSVAGDIITLDRGRGPTIRRIVVLFALGAVLDGCYLAHERAVASRGPDASRDSPGTITPPRPIAPLSTATVTSRHPTFRWELAPGTDGASLELCSDRACANVFASAEVTGTHTALTRELQPGVVFWRLRSRVGTLVGADVSPTWELIVGARGARIDTSWGTTLDVNGDGYADVVVGAPGASSNTGRAYVYLGSPSGLSTSPATVLIGRDASGRFGGSVASAGDVNGDGYADVVVGANSAHYQLGRAYLYLGGPSGLGASLVLGTEGISRGFGASVACAGDVNDDGYADVVVGADGATYVDREGVYLYLGSASGLPAIASASLARESMEYTVGGSVAGAGDVNGDGYADVVVAANHPFSPVTGHAYVYFGTSSGLGAIPAVRLDNPDGSTQAVASAGDVNGDGFADIAVGAIGAAFLYLGSASGSSTAPAVNLTPTDTAPTETTFGFSIAGADRAHIGRWSFSSRSTCMRTRS